ASNLAGRYNAKGEYIVAWNSIPDHQVDGWAIIDCMMNLPLLYWAYEESGNPSFLHIAMNHADTTAKVFIRPDGSSRHIV
ncbi:MAG: glycosyl hydrolase family 88, partial [Lachnospiraceae bacterium]|nr:glycosyl hydrolase family 88 [Lachnospiraceae bacterium]